MAGDKAVTMCEGTESIARQGADGTLYANSVTDLGQNRDGMMTG